MQHCIRFSDRPIRDTVRYILYRAYLAGHPDVHGVHAGEEFTHRGRLYSAIFDLVSSHEPDAQRMSVVVKGDRVTIQATEESALATHLVDDAVWGPDWLVTERSTR